MKRFFISGLILVCSMLCCNSLPAFSQKTFQGNVQSTRIPKGTVLKLQLLDPVSTKIGAVGDEFNAMLISDKMIGSKIALPAGSVFRGTINNIIPAKRLSRSAVIYVGFDHVVSPTGRQIPVGAGLLNYPFVTVDGGLYEGGNYGWALQQNWKQTKKITSNAVNWGKGTGENLQYVFTPIGAVGGAIGGGAYFIGDSVADLFRKGNNVDLQQGTKIDAILLQPIDVPVH
jgi:hypothetical protein